ncbi:MAG: hypothetical protein JWO71_1357 [Candidatus Acidoferrum typicum]|nr:hypothetical protein [Candidatus Acidoferrum typicum]
MKLFRVSRISMAVAFLLFFAGSLKLSGIAAQNEAAAAQESVQSLQVTANDEIAAGDTAGHHVHLHPLRAPAAVGHRYEDPEIRQGNRQNGSSGIETGSGATNSALSTVPGVPAPGFYPADLSNSTHGKVLTSVQSNNVYVNCAANCWGTPSTFLARLAVSNFIHVTDEYAGATGNNRYTVGTATSINTPLPAKLSSNNILQLVHTAARAHGSGYDHIYHIFLRSGVDVCTSANVCYSPDNTSTFVFCAYHGSVDFQDIGHVLYSVEPYQNVRGCSVAQPSPNGALVDSTSSTLSHELIETITDPDGNAWFAQSSLIEYGAEIGDICENPFGKYGAFAISGKSYAIQPEYSNKYHSCATMP